MLTIKRERLGCTCDLFSRHRVTSSRQNRTGHPIFGRGRICDTRPLINTGPTQFIRFIRMPHTSRPGFTLDGDDRNNSPEFITRLPKMPIASPGICSASSDARHRLLYRRQMRLPRVAYADNGCRGASGTFEATFPRGRRKSPLFPNYRVNGQNRSLRSRSVD